jgi:preprotein translocase subunit SecE
MENERLPEKKAASWPQKVKDYVTDLQTEMRRVTWPSWKQVRATTTVVVVSVFAFSAYFRVVDFFVERGVSRIFTTFTR